MLNNIMNMFNKNSNNQIQAFMNMVQEIKNSGMTPQEYAFKILKVNKVKINPEEMEKFKNFAKQYGATDEQIDELINNFEKK